MGIDVTQWRARIGTFCQSARIKSFLPVLEIGKITIAIRVVLFLLLVVHGVESNPGPSDVGERSCSKMRQCRGLSVDKELRKACDGGRLLIDEANIDTTTKIRPNTGLQQKDSVSHELSTIKPESQSQHNSQFHSQPQPLNLFDQQNRTESLSQPQSHSQPLYLSDPQKRSESESLSQQQSDSQQLNIQNRSESQNLIQCQSQLSFHTRSQLSQSLCTFQESIMNSSILLELKQLKERVDSLESENVSLNRRVEDLETSKERVTEDDKAAVDEEGEREDRTEPKNCCLSDSREEDHDAEECSSDEVVNGIADKMLSSDNMELPLVEDLKGLIDSVMKPTLLKTVGQHTDVTKHILIKCHTSGMNTDLITKRTGQSKTTLLQELCSKFMSSKLCDKGSSDTRKRYLNRYGDHFPPRNNNCIVSAIPFIVSFRTVPLPPRRLIALNNNMYQYERVRLASFSTYVGSGFGVVFAKAGFVFDLATNMVVCPWCLVFVYNNVNINNMHLSDCVFLQINIPFHNVPSPSVPGPHRRDCRQVGCVNVPPAPEQMPNRQSIGRSGSIIRSEPTPVSPVAGKNGVSSQAHAMGGSTEPSSCLDSLQSTLPETIGMPNRTDSFKHAIPSNRTFSETCQSSVYCWNTRNATSSRDMTFSLNQCHQSASEHKSTVPSGSSKREEYSTDSTHLVVPEHSSRGNGNTWGRCPCSYDPEQVTKDAENKDEKRDNSRRANSSNGSKAHSRIDVGNNNLCKVCQEGAVCVVFLPCNHMATCQNCATTVRKCIICRTHIKSRKASTDL